MRPEHATLLRLFDYAGAVLYGASASTFAGYILPGSWPMPAGMFAGMALGMASAFPVLMLLTILCGGLEIIMMAMLIGMTAGMGAGMAGEKSLIWFVSYGAVVGLCIQVALHIHDLKKHGDVHTEETDRK